MIGRFRQAPSFGEQAQAVRELFVRYLNEQLVVPLQGAGRQLGFGVVGGILIGIGGVLLTLAMLRALQTETGTALAGNWSFVPYLATIVVVTVVCVATVAILQRKDAS